MIEISGGAGGKYELKGAAQVLQKLRDIEHRTEKEITRPGASAMAKVVKQRAISIVEGLGLIKSGAMVRNIAYKFQRGNPDTLAEYHVGVRHSAAKPEKTIRRRVRFGSISITVANDPWYWWFQEFGTRRGIKPRHFIEQALAQSQSAALSAMVAAVEKGLHEQ
jgi:HK97 gp10 family phage protein